MRWFASMVSPYLPEVEEISVGDEALDYFGPITPKTMSWTLEVHYHVHRDYLGTVVAVSGKPQFGRK